MAKTGCWNIIVFTDVKIDGYRVYGRYLCIFYIGIIELRNSLRKLRMHIE